MKTLLILTLLTLGTQAAVAQDATQMLRDVRLSAVVQKVALEGTVTKLGKRGISIPIGLFVQDGNIQFDLGAQGHFNIRLLDENCQLSEVASDHTTTPLPASKLSSTIGGTDATYEDLTLRFLYWPNPELKGVVNIEGQDCYHIFVKNPGDEGAFKSVSVFIHKKYGALWDVKAYGKDDQELKEFVVREVMKLPDGSYTIKKMEIDAKAKGSVTGMTTLNFKNPEAKKFGGLRK